MGNLLGSLLKRFREILSAGPTDTGLSSGGMTHQFLLGGDIYDG